MKFLLTGLLFSLALSAAAQQTTTQTVDDIRIAKDKPTVYLTFERFGKAIDPSRSRIAETQVATSESKKKGDDVWLRLHNNTRWSIVFRTWSYYFGKITKPYRPGEGSSFQLSDGMEVNTIYTVIESDGRRVASAGDTYNLS